MRYWIALAVVLAWAPPAAAQWVPNNWVQGPTLPAWCWRSVGTMNGCAGAIRAARGLPPASIIIPPAPVQAPTNCYTQRTGAGFTTTCN